MEQLSASQAIQRIKAAQCFEAQVCEESFYIKIENYNAIACFAIHSGHRFAPALQKKCALNDYERWFEEDPQTLDFIKDQPIVFAANDSRYAYDLNRSQNHAVYDIAWGKKVWNESLSSEEMQTATQKHRLFYQLLDALLYTLHLRNQTVVIFDIHSFNYIRMPKEAPVFNLGTILVKNKRFRPLIDAWLHELKQITLDGKPVTVSENDVFVGDGYLAEYINTNYPETLVLVNEIKKVYCNELNGELHRAIIQSLSQQIQKAIVNWMNLLR